MTLTGSDNPADRIKQLTGRRFCAVRSFILNAFLELSFLTPVFCSNLLDTCFPKFCCQLILHVRCQLLLSFSWPCIRHFENVSAAQLWNPRYTEKGDLLEPFSRSFSLALPFSHEYENTKLFITKHITSLISSLLLAFSTGNHLHCRDQQIPRWPRFFQLVFFPFVPPCQWPFSIALW